VAAP
jgi:hypothetical protein